MEYFLFLFSSFEIPEQFVDALVCRDWNVHIKMPFSTPQRVVSYIGRYSQKIAISKNRLIKIQEDRVHFSFKNHRYNGLWEQTSLSAREFIIRFLSHVLPTGFHKIRHFGFLANGRCKAMVPKIRAQLDQALCNQPALLPAPGQPCPQCATGTMQPMIIRSRLFTIIKPGYRLANSTAWHDSS